jgi:hypothetical protein
MCCKEFWRAWPPKLPHPLFRLAKFRADRTVEHEPLPHLFGTGMVQLTMVGFLSSLARRATSLPHSR